MTNAASTRDKRAALHEASHAVAAWRIGYRVSFVELTEDGGSTGHDPGCDPLAIGIVTAAGHAADVKWNGMQREHITVDDHLTLVALGFRGRSLASVLGMARGLVEVYAEDIQRVAKELECRDLGYDDMVELLGECELAEDVPKTRFAALRLVVWLWFIRTLSNPTTNATFISGPVYR